MRIKVTFTGPTICVLCALALFALPAHASEVNAPAAKLSDALHQIAGQCSPDIPWMYNPEPGQEQPISKPVVGHYNCDEAFRLALPEGYELVLTTLPGRTPVRVVRRVGTGT